jgi:hypothetical protein
MKTDETRTDKAKTDPDNKTSGEGGGGALESRPGRDHEPTAEFPPEAQPPGGKGEGRRDAVQRAPEDQRKGARPGKKESAS